HERDSVDVRPTKSSSELPLAFPPELLAHDAARTASNVATPSQPNIRPEIRRCNSNVCAIVAPHFRRPPLSQFVSLGELRLASQQDRQSRSHLTADSGSRMQSRITLRRRTGVDLHS